VGFAITPRWGSKPAPAHPRVQQKMWDMPFLNQEGSSWKLPASDEEGWRVSAGVVLMYEWWFCSVARLAQAPSRTFEKVPADLVRRR
jgi:hypothetical protein